MDIRPILTELLVSGFFAIACLRARGDDFGQTVRSPREFFRLLPRLERLRRTRWQWFAMVLLLYVMRREIGVPILVELTALAQFVIFLALPVASKVSTPAGKQSAPKTPRPMMRARAAVR